MTDERKLKQAAYEIFKSPKSGDLLMDAPKTDSWRELKTYVEDRDFWKARVRCLRQQPVVSVKLDTHVVDESWSLFTVSS